MHLTDNLGDPQMKRWWWYNAETAKPRRVARFDFFDISDSLIILPILPEGHKHSPATPSPRAASNPPAPSSTMLIAIVGTPSAGKHTILEYLVSNHAFRRVGLTSPSDPMDAARLVRAGFVACGLRHGHETPAAQQQLAAGS